MSEFKITDEEDVDLVESGKVGVVPAWSSPLYRSDEAFLLRSGSDWSKSCQWRGMA